MSSRRSYPERQFRARQRQFLRDHRSILTRLVLLGAACIALWALAVSAVLPRGPMSGWLIGVGQTAFVMSFLILLRSVHLSKDPYAAQLYRGALGESSTADELRAAERRDLIWGRVDGLSTGGGDIDHLVVSRYAGLWAVDSKYLSSVDHLDRAAEAARSAARRAQSVLRSVHQLTRDSSARHRDDVPSFQVRPLIVLWGAIRDQVDVEFEQGGVRFVRGDHLQDFIRHQNGEPVSPQVAHDLLAALERFRDRVRTSD